MGAFPAPHKGGTGPAAAPSPRASARARHYSRTDVTARDSATSVTASSPARRGASHKTITADCIKYWGFQFNLDIKT